MTVAHVCASWANEKMTKYLIDHNVDFLQPFGVYFFLKKYNKIYFSYKFNFNYKLIKLL